jgi:DNA invertase Pin-like site-specific DNA recombinase
MPEGAKRFWESKKPRGPRGSKYTEDIRRLAEQGLSGYEIARQLGIWPSQVYMTAKRAGIVLKPAPRAAGRVARR